MRRARAVAIPRPGGPEVLEVVEREVRDPAPGEILLRVAAAAVNPTDIGLRLHGAEGIPPPWTPGMDAAGTIEAVGDGVDSLVEGQTVMAAVMPRRPEGGAQAERIVIPAASAAPLPEQSTIEEAATLPMNGLTAKLALQMLALSPGTTLGVTGGAGLLASYAIPLAKLAGLRVIADANPEDEELVRGYGADELLPRGRFSEAARELLPEGLDGVLDTALLGRDAFAAIRDGGAMAVVRGWEGGEPPRGIRIHKVFVFEVLERTDWLRELAQAVEARQIRLRVAAEFPPEQASSAQQMMERGGIRGRALILF